ncbi:hypothetical protein FDECE_9039 [Fusarium decemcellulare]|nr:hypothetical protein FDECE_9039 [Fusarium decemcellulare]
MAGYLARQQAIIPGPRGELGSYGTSHRPPHARTCQHEAWLPTKCCLKDRKGMREASPLVRRRSHQWYLGMTRPPWNHPSKDLPTSNQHLQRRQKTPTDDQHLEMMGKRHADTTSLLNESLRLAPLPEKLQSVLEVGTGTVSHIDEKATHAAIVDDVKGVIRGERKALEKGLFYLKDGWEDVGKESYQTQAELGILQGDFDRIFPSGEMHTIIELGPGTFDKTGLLLRRLAKEKKCTILYIAVDVNQHFLNKYTPSLDRDLDDVTCVGLCGTFNQALECLQPVDDRSGDIRSFGSSLSNNSPKMVVATLKGWKKETIQNTYFTESHQRLIWNGLATANELVSEEVFKRPEWTLEHSIGSHPKRHRFEIRANVTSRDTIRKGTTIDAFTSWKFTAEELAILFGWAGYRIANSFGVQTHGSRIYILEIDPAVVPSVHCVLIRHSESISNHEGGAGNSGFDVTTATPEQTRSFIEEIEGGQIKTPVTSGDWMEGLTAHGKAVASTRGPARLDSVYVLGSSACLRAFHTVKPMADCGYFEPVGHLCLKEGKPLIRVYRLICEATSWSQDLPLMETESDGERKAHYIEIEGGGSGRVLGEATVHLQNLIWCDDSADKFNTPASRRDALNHRRSPEEVEKDVDEFLEKFFELAWKVSWEHVRLAHPGTARMVLVNHGSIGQFLTRRWRCQYKREDENSAWKFGGSSVLGHLDTTVHKFHCESDGRITLEEIPRHSDYEKVFAEHYRVLGEESEQLLHKHQNGRLVDQKADNFRFIRNVAAMTKRVTDERPGLVAIFANWKGANAALRHWKWDHREQTKLKAL